MRPPTNDPKSNVLYFALLGCTCAALLLVLMGEGAWRWLAVVPVLVGAWLFVAVVRRAKDVDPDLTS